MTCCTESWCISIVVMYGEKECLAGVETLAQSPACRMDTRETLAAKAAEAAAPQSEPRDICALATTELSLPKTKRFYHTQACAAYC